MVTEDFLDSFGVMRSIIEFGASIGSNPARVLLVILVGQSRG